MVVSVSNLRWRSSKFKKPFKLNCVSSQSSSYSWCRAQYVLNLLFLPHFHKICPFNFLQDLDRLFCTKLSASANAILETQKFLIDFLLRKLLRENRYFASFKTQEKKRSRRLYGSIFGPKQERNFWKSMPSFRVCFILADQM